MAKILCDCGCGRLVTKRIFASDACRKRIDRGIVHKTDAKAPETPTDVRNKDAPTGTFAENKYGRWKDGVWMSNNENGTN